jgi:hypothetical protein
MTAKKARRYANLAIRHGHFVNPAIEILFIRWISGHGIGFFGDLFGRRAR